MHEGLLDRSFGDLACLCAMAYWVAGNFPPASLLFNPLKTGKRQILRLVLPVVAIRPEAL